MIYKNVPEKYLRKVMTARFFLDHVAALQYVLKGDISNAKAILRARREFRKLRPLYEEVRKENLEAQTVVDIPEVLNRSLVFASFLKGVKKFSDLRF